jgi:hypothetical protein
MNEVQLTQADRERIKTDIKLTSIIGLLFSVALLVLVFVIPLILYFIGKPADGFAKRSMQIICLLLLPFIAVSWSNIFKGLDLIVGRKINFQTTDYQVKETKDGFVLKIISPYKIEFDLFIIPSTLRDSDSITVEIGKLSKTLLHLAQGNENLLERIEEEVEQPYKNV